MFHKSKRKTPPTQAELRQRVRRRMTLRGVLAFFVVLTMIRAAFMHRFENIFVCVLALILLALPSIIEKQLAIDIPPLMEGIIYCFIYAAEILGEINSFYTIIPGWDTMLHTINGFLVAAVGFCLVDLFNRSERFTFRLSPLFLALVAFCFSMTVGVLWEFFEFTCDQVMHTDMQKDYVVHEINSVSLNPDGLNTPIHVPIESVIVNGEDWTEEIGGYLDIGLIDTMKDLQVNCIGAIAFSVIGFFYVKRRRQGKVAAAFIPVVLNEPEDNDMPEKEKKDTPEWKKSRGFYALGFVFMGNEPVPPPESLALLSLSRYNKGSTAKENEYGTRNHEGRGVPRGGVGKGDSGGYGHRARSAGDARGAQGRLRRHGGEYDRRAQTNHRVR